ncbi:MAG: hypothetical protein DI537_20325 [Stutzerimonas stutzeri]|nr:MAG: hypothetical protein DI537_20325 [Stutzerimonas stutzeri]
MPQASEELRSKMMKRFGSMDTPGPEDFLKQAGYKLNAGWAWVPKPGVTQYRDMSRAEFDCLLFLIHEWDYRGFEHEPTA